MTRHDTRHARRSVHLWIGYWCFAFLLTHLPPGAAVGVPIPGADKAVHYCLYFVLTWLGGRAVRATQGRFDTGSEWKGALLFACYGVLDEWLQGFVGRTPSLYDWFADLAGILSATLWMLWRRPDRGSPGETPSEQRADPFVTPD